MACDKRQKTGSCTHHQCGFQDRTQHGYQCVDVVDGYCEVGSGCVTQCQFSWAEDDTEAARGADAAFCVDALEAMNETREDERCVT